jgi:prepilin-type N-terminal cleavage/methylation domain-containing protein/prepilin-type processing-associated H-X9-DG protein
MKRRGFTLIELLVVIAIIAILAAILFPVYVKAKEMAQTTKCGAHGKQIGTSMLMYLDDNNGRFPSSIGAWPAAERDAALTYLQGITWRYSWPGDTRPGHDIWNATDQDTGFFRNLVLFKYIRNQDVWICPSASSLYALKFAKGYRCNWRFLRWEFGMDSKYPDTPFQDGSSGLGRTLTEIQSRDASVCKRYVPATRKIFAFCYALGCDVSVETYAGSGKLEPPMYPHSNGSIYVYCDGHAKWAETGRGWAPVGYTNQPVDKPHPNG